MVVFKKCFFHATASRVPRFTGRPASWGSRKGVFGVRELDGDLLLSVCLSTLPLLSLHTFSHTLSSPFLFPTLVRDLLVFLRRTT